MGPIPPRGPQTPGRSRALADAGQWLARSGYGARWSTDEPPPPALWHAFNDALCSDSRPPGLRAECDQRLRDACRAAGQVDGGGPPGPA